MFITVGYDNNKYLDIVAHGYYPLSKYHIISGKGIVDNNNITCKNIKLHALDVVGQNVN
jgi:hypothetical protein